MLNLRTWAHLLTILLVQSCPPIVGQKALPVTTASAAREAQGSLQEPAADPAEPDYSINITPLQSSFHLDDEPAIDVVSTNLTDHRILVAYTMSARGLYGIQVKDSDGHPAGVQPAYANYPPLYGSNFAQEVKPGAAFKERIKLRKLYRLDTEGMYTVQLIKSDAKTKVLSNTITIYMVP
jgi:hypothetical protein